MTWMIRSETMERLIKIGINAFVLYCFYLITYLKQDIMRRFTLFDGQLVTICDG